MGPVTVTSAQYRFHCSSSSQSASLAPGGTATTNMEGKRVKTGKHLGRISKISVGQTQSRTSRFSPSLSHNVCSITRASDAGSVLLLTTNGREREVSWDLLRHLRLPVRLRQPLWKNRIMRCGGRGSPPVAGGARESVDPRCRSLPSQGQSKDKGRLSESDTPPTTVLLVPQYICNTRSLIPCATGRQH